MELSNDNKKIKSKIKVFLLVSDEKGVDKIYKYKDAEGHTQYSGFLWDVWSSIEKKLDNKYEFIYIEAKKDDNNYDDFVKNTANGTYDIVVGMFFKNADREKVISYSQPYLLDANTILHEYNTSYITSLQRVVIDSGNLIMYLITFGIVAGIILWLLDHNRSKYLPHILAANSQKAKFFRALDTGISAMFGEMGYLSENASMNWLSFLLVILLMTVSFVLVLFVQGEFTVSLLNYVKASPYNVNNIPDKPCLGFKGDAIPKTLEKFGVKVKYVENMTTLEMIEKYLNNKDKYSGVITTYLDALNVQKQLGDKDLVYGLDFGYEAVSFIINSNKQDLLKDVNRQILYMRSDLKLQNMCNSNFSYYTNVAPFVCSLA
jgi:ABC-type amino acid transport substrate-binding protein